MSFDSSVFHSEDLRSAIDASHKFIEEHENLRDRVSDDIKALEKYLETNGPKETFRVSFGKAFVPPEDDQMIQASLEYSGSASGEIHEDALVWKADLKGRYRIYHELSCWDGCVDVDMPGGPLFHDSSTLRCESRPLIESPFAVRKLMAPKLPQFVNALAQHIADGAGIVIESETDEIPF